MEKFKKESKFVLSEGKVKVVLEVNYEKKTFTILPGDAFSGNEFIFKNGKNFDMWIAVGNLIRNAAEVAKIELDEKLESPEERVISMVGINIKRPSAKPEGVVKLTVQDWIDKLSGRLKIWPHNLNDKTEFRLNGTDKKFNISDAIIHLAEQSDFNAPGTLVLTSSGSILESEWLIVSNEYLDKTSEPLIIVAQLIV